MGDGSGSRIGVDIEVVLQTISKLYLDPDVAVNNQLPEVASDWGEGGALDRFHKVLSGTVAYTREMMTSTDQFSSAMSLGMEGAVEDLKATNHAAAEQADKLLQDVIDSQTGTAPPAQDGGAAAAAAGSARAPSRTASDIAAIMQGDASGGLSGGSPVSGGSSGGGRF